MLEVLDDEVSQLIRKVVAVVPDANRLTPLFRTLETLAVGSVKEQLARGVDPGGRPHKPLARARPSGGAQPLKHTGGMGGGIEARATAPGLTLRSRAPQAALHQHGGVIAPKTARALAIPMTPAAARAGSPRAFGAPLHVRSKQMGKGALFDPSGAMQYALTNRVVVPARRWLGVGDKHRRQMARAIQLFAARYLFEPAQGGGMHA